MGDLAVRLIGANAALVDILGIEPEDPAVSESSQTTACQWSVIGLRRL